MKRILVIGQLQFGYLTDTYKYCLHLRERYDVTYLGWDYGLKKVEVDGVRIRHVSRDGVRLMRLARLLKAAFEEMRSQSHERVFIVYFQGAGLLRWARGGREAFLDIRTGSDRPGTFRRFFDNWLLWCESALFSRVSIVSKSLIDELHLTRRRCHVLPLGGDRRGQTRKTFDDLRLLYVGTLDQRNIHLTVEAFARFTKECSGLRSAHYDIIGAGPDEDTRMLHEAIRRNNCSAQVIVHGWIPNAEIDPFLDRGNAGVGFIPRLRYYDCQPSTKVFEYLLAGMPTIATNTRENAAVISDTNGVLVDDTVDGFYHGLRAWFERRLCYDSDVIRASVQQYSWDRIVNENLVPYLAANGIRNP